MNAYRAWRITAVFLLAMLCAASVAPGEVMITEILYAGRPERPDQRIEEFVELYNNSDSAADLSGWQFDKGIQFEFPAGTVLEPRGALVVSSDPSTTQQRATCMVLGPFGGGLKARGEELRLVDRSGGAVAGLHYARFGMWPRMQDEHSIELRSVGLPAAFGACWQASASPGGTPGSVHAEGPVQPVVLDGWCAPAAPMAGSTVSIHIETAGTRGLADAPQLEVRWGDGSQLSSRLALAHAAGNGVQLWTASVQVPDSPGVFEYAIAGLVRPPGLPLFLGVVDGGTRPPAEGGIRLLLSREASRELAQRPLESNVVLPATVIDPNGRTTHGAGIRYRGSASRELPRKPFKIELPSDRPVRGMTRLNLIRENIAASHVSYRLFEAAGNLTPSSQLVQMAINDGPWEWAELLEQLDKDFLRRVFPGDFSGELYRGQFKAGLWEYFEDFEYDLFYDPIAGPVDARRSKVRALSEGLLTWSEEEFAARFAELVDVEAFLRYFAIQMVINNNEGGIQLDYGDDYFLYFRPSDGRAVILPWDMNETFEEPIFSLWRTRLLPVNRVLRHREFAPRFAAMTKQYGEELLGPRLEEIVREMPPALRLSAGTSVREFAARRQAMLLPEIGTVLTIDEVECLESVTLIPRGAEWEFTAPTGGLESLIVAPRREWNRGKAPFSLKESGEGTTVPALDWDQRSLLFARSFEVSYELLEKLNPEERLRLEARFEDAIIVALNGHEVARVNAGEAGADPMPAWGGSDVVHEPSGYRAIDLGPAAQLREGTNRIEVRVLDIPWGRTDIYFDGELRLERVVPAVSRENGDYVAFSQEIRLRGRLDQTQTSTVNVDGDECYSIPWQNVWEHRLLLDGGLQRVTVQAHGPAGERVGEVVAAFEVMNGYQPFPELVDEDVELHSGKPYLLLGESRIGAGASLTIGPGVSIVSREGARMAVEGVLHVNGASGNSVNWVHEGFSPMVMEVGKDAAMLAGWLDASEVAIVSRAGGAVDVDMSTLKVSEGPVIRAEGAPPGDGVLSVSLPKRLFDGVTVVGAVRALNEFGSRDRFLPDQKAKVYAVAGKSGAREPVGEVDLVHGGGTFVWTPNIGNNESVQYSVLVIGDGVQGSAQVVMEREPFSWGNFVRVVDLLKQEHWSREKPYIIDGQVTIHEDQELVIDPGVFVVFDRSAKIHNLGKVVAHGTDDDPVQFVPWKAGEPWAQIVNFNEGRGLDFTNVHFTGGGGGSRQGHVSGPMVSVLRGSAAFRKCIFTQFDAQPIWSGEAVDGVLMDNCMVTHTAQGSEFIAHHLLLRDSLFAHQHGPDDNDGLYLIGRGDHHVLRCDFALVDDDGIDTAESNVIVDRCIIRGCFDKGVSTTGAAPLLIDTWIGDSDAGIVFAPWTSVAHALVLRCTLTGLTSQGLWMRNSPPMNHLGSARFHVHGSTIQSMGAAGQIDWPVTDVQITGAVMSNREFDGATTVEVGGDGLWEPLVFPDGVAPPHRGGYTRPKPTIIVSRSTVQSAEGPAIVAAGSAVELEESEVVAGSSAIVLGPGGALTADKSTFSAGEGYAVVHANSSDVYLRRCDLSGGSIPIQADEESIVFHEDTAPFVSLPYWLDAPGRDLELRRLESAVKLRSYWKVPR